MKKKVSEQDKEHLYLLRANVESFMEHVSKQYAHHAAYLLDIAPQDHKGARPFFDENIKIDTLDINPDSGATYIADLCGDSDLLPNEKFEFVVCTEVLEHVLQPFTAVRNIYNMLKPGGYVFVSTPFNFRIHGPLPDCWRFTEHGLRQLFRQYEIIELNALQCESRFLMPIQYTLVAQRSFFSGHGQ